MLGAASELLHPVMAAALWHWRHGDSTNLGGYRVAVPKSWFVEDTNGTILGLARAPMPLPRTQFESNGTFAIHRPF